MGLLSRINDYMGLVKFAHTIFAMPFALIAFAYALRTTDAEFSWPLLVQVILCMVFARNVAMGFNRWTDWRIDKENPRTASREIPAGKISPRSAMTFVTINAILFIVTASSINSLTAILSPH
jgi:4-hydroxybenzoate polyprenyltransferase